MQMEKLFELIDKNVEILNNLKIRDKPDDEIAINIIIDDSDPQSPIFVEIEDDEGKSIQIGERSINSEGLTTIKISVFDIRSYG